MTDKSAALTPQAIAIVIAGCVTVLISFGSPQFLRSVSARYVRSHGLGQGSLGPITGNPKPDVGSRHSPSPAHWPSVMVQGRSWLAPQCSLLHWALLERPGIL